MRQYFLHAHLSAQESAHFNDLRGCEEPPSQDKIVSYAIYFLQMSSVREKDDEPGWEGHACANGDRSIGLNWESKRANMKKDNVENDSCIDDVDELSTEDKTTSEIKIRVRGPQQHQLTPKNPCDEACTELVRCWAWNVLDALCVIAVDEVIAEWR